jgi:hypothetical protein
MNTEITIGGTRAAIRVPPAVVSARTAGETKIIQARPVGLEAIRDLRDGWDEEDAIAPNETAMARAYLAQSVLHRNWLVPDRTVADADGGVAFWFYSPDDGGPASQAAIECKNTPPPRASAPWA